MITDDIRHIVNDSRANAVRPVDFCRVQMYVNYYDRYEKSADETPTIGILLCTEKNDTFVRMSLPEDNNAIIVSKYQLYLPTEQQLIAEVGKIKSELKSKTNGTV